MIWTKGRHFGRLGLRIKLMCASRGSRLPLRVLQGIQEQTQHSVEIENVAQPDEVGVNQTKKHEPQHAPVMNIGSFGGGTLAGQAVDWRRR